MASAICDAIEPGCSAEDGDRIGTRTDTKAKGDTAGPEVAKSKMNITTPVKTSIVVSY